MRPHHVLRRSLTALGAVLALALPVLTAPAAATTAAPQPTAGVTDPGFETGDGWAVEGDAAAYSLKADGARSGSLNGSLWRAEPFSASVTTAVTGLEPGWWTARVWVRSGSAVPGQSLGATTVSTRGCGLDGTVTAPSSEADDAWTQVAVSMEVTREALDAGTCALVLTTEGVHGGEWARFDDVTLEPGRAQRLVRGADLSGVAKNEALGQVYRGTDGQVGDPYALMGSTGANLARFKVWVSPADGYNTVEHVVASAQRAQAAGMQVMIDFHYSDTWTDPGKQHIPSSWTADDPQALAAELAAHTTDVLTALKEAGVDVAYVQVGNEINPGMLWPQGQTWDVDPSDAVSVAQWDNLAAFLRAGTQSVRDVFPQARTILHLTNINNGLSSLTWWYDEVFARGVTADVLGLSYYGYWHGTLGDLQTVATGLIERYGTDVLVVETAYPFTLEDDNPTWENIVARPDMLVAGYPATPEGQAQWLRDVGTVVAALPGGHGLGFVAWEPAWTAIAGNGWDEKDPASGNAWENQAVFDFQDRLLPTAAYAFGDDVLTPSTLPEPAAPTTPGTPAPGSAEGTAASSSSPTASPGAAGQSPDPVADGGAAPRSSLARTGAPLALGAAAAALLTVGTLLERRRR
ncbi:MULTISPECIES: glycosyl hydrolase 53 family protein [unclassified Actinomyces]|uniref:glycoside hydrolase family 53 protein n=1 Tax=unclassified Actinomyces TaxID=2609248 RepID=UPI002017C1FC|nr:MULTISPECIES: glycosyl hydrolase 53 family protein [unclassified Actinomyces]MCL3777871.1 glycosyl hydrolase 53 family protein [Actinomyces sp. AC-20-1]MCL3789248.1 glycosyl hydrolase 53 family protein [Actinomyces sp. 187325]MCL3791601.1 glycosyl hydrolase 53 family protein [Actinomyces sp. 186855]MCL3793543.1 glycosyl hydrolase 53 family protein [Actinomyces sp. 217892]